MKRHSWCAGLVIGFVCLGSAVAQSYPTRAIRLIAHSSPGGTSDILGRLIDQEIDVFRESARAVRDDGKAANQHVVRAGVVQGATDADEVFRLGCSCVRSIIWIIHASASSKLEKR